MKKAIYKQIIIWIEQLSEMEKDDSKWHELQILKNKLKEIYEEKKNNN